MRSGPPPLCLEGAKQESSVAAGGIEHSHLAARECVISNFFNARIQINLNDVLCLFNVKITVFRQTSPASVICST